MKEALFFSVYSKRLQAASLALMALLLCSSAYADNSSITMLPPTTNGSTLCSPNQNQILIYSGISTGAINCIPVNFTNNTLALSGAFTVSGTSLLNTLTVSSNSIMGGDLWLGSTSPTGTTWDNGTAEAGPSLHFSGNTGWNSDDIYFQRWNSQKNMSELVLVLGDDAQGTYSDSTTAGDAFIIGALDAGNNNAWVPRFTFTGNGLLGVGTVSPQGNVDIENGQGTATLCINGKCSSNIAPNGCHQVVANGVAPNYVADARCAAGEYALNGGGVANHWKSAGICPAGTPAAVVNNDGFLHTSVPDADMQGWSVDAYAADGTGEACASAYVMCCPR